MLLNQYYWPEMSRGDVICAKAKLYQWTIITPSAGDQDYKRQLQIEIIIQII